MAVGIMAPTILFTTNEAKAYEQNQQEIQQASEQLQKMGEGAL